jgi:hypothetical protein
MKSTLSILALTMAFAAPAFADEMKDVSKMTCKEMAAMDMDGMMSATMALKEAAKGDAMADKSMMDMKDEDLMKAVEAKCAGKDDMMVMDAMHGSM